MDTSLAQSEWIDPSVPVPSVLVPSVPAPSVPVPSVPVPSVPVPSVPDLLEAYARESGGSPDTNFVFGLDDTTAAMWEGDEWIGESPHPAESGNGRTW